MYDNPYIMLSDREADLLNKTGGSGFQVYCGLLRYRNRKTGRCNPSVETVAKKLNLSQKTVERAFIELEKVFLLFRNYKQGVTTQYDFPTRLKWQLAMEGEVFEDNTPDNTVAPTPDKIDGLTRRNRNHIHTGISMKEKRAKATCMRNLKSLQEEYPDNDIKQELEDWITKCVAAGWDVGKNATAHMKNFRKWLDKAFTGEKTKSVGFSKYRPPIPKKPLKSYDDIKPEPKYAKYRKHKKKL